jgi:hypothetical protein
MDNRDFFLFLSEGFCDNIIMFLLHILCCTGFRIAAFNAAARFLKEGAWVE